MQPSELPRRTVSLAGDVVLQRRRLGSLARERGTLVYASVQDAVHR